MDMNIVTLPKKGLKTMPYSMDMNKKDHIVTLPKKGLKARPYSMDMNKENHIVTPPKKGLNTRPYNTDMEKRDLKTRPYNIDIEKKDLKKLTKGQLIKLLMNQRNKPNTHPWESLKPKPIPRKSVNKDIILPPPEQFQDEYRPISKPRTDRTPKHEFNFDDDIFQTRNQSLEKFKIIRIESRENKKFKSYKTNSKLKSLRSWKTLKRYITYSKN